MTLSLIEQLTGSAGQTKTEASGVAQPGVFADLLLAAGESKATGESAPTAESDDLLTLLLGAPQTSPANPIGDFGSGVGPALAQDPATSSAGPATANAGTTETGLLLAAQAGNSKPVSQQGTGSVAPTATSTAATGTPIAGLPGGISGNPTGATSGTASPDQTLGPNMTDGDADLTIRPTGPAPGTSSAAATGSSAAQSGTPAALAGSTPQNPAGTAQAATQTATQIAGRQAGAAQSASQVASAAGTTADTGDEQDRSGAISTQTRVTVSDAAAAARTAGPLSPETAAAILSSNEQAQIAAQGGVRPGTVGATKDSIGRLTREARSELRNPRTAADGITTSHAPSRPGGSPTRPSTAARSNEVMPSQLNATTGAMAPPAGFELPVGARSEASVQAWLAPSPTTDTVTGTGSLTESQRGLWRPATPSTQVAVHIKKAIGEGRDQVTVRLEPAELGRIEVKLAASNDGTLRAAIVADRAETLDLLQTDSRALERALQDAGLKTNSDSLSFNLRGEGQNGKFAERDANGGSGESSDSGQSDDSNSGTEPATNRSHHSGTLDISV